MLASELHKLNNGDLVYLRKTGITLLVEGKHSDRGVFARTLNAIGNGYIPLVLIQSFKPQGIIDV